MKTNFGLVIVVLLVSFASAQTVDESIFFDEDVEVGFEENIPVEEIEMLVKSADPEEFGISEIRRDNIEIKTIGTIVSVNHETTEDLIKGNIKVLKAQGGFDKIMSFLKGVRSHDLEPVVIERTLRVYEFSPIYENKKDLFSYRTSVSLDVKADKDYEELMLIQIFSKDVATDFTELFFDKNPLVIEKKDVLALYWNFKDIKKEDEVSIKYFVKTLVIGDEDDVILAVGKPVGGVVGKDDIEITGFIVNSNLAAEIEQNLKKYGFNFANSLLIFSLIAILIIAGMIFVMELHGHGRFQRLKNLVFEVHSSAKVGAKNKRTLELYVSDCMKKGMSFEDIRASLVKAGWDKKVVRNTLNKYI